MSRSPYWRTCTATACASLLALLARGADIHPELLPGMRLDGSALLKGFARADARPHTFGVSIEEAPGATAAVSGRHFLGSSELRTHVLLFPTREALDEWDREEGRSNPSWGFQPHRGRDETDEVRGGVPGTGRAVRVVNRVLVIVYGFQHPEAKRRNPAAFKAALTDRQLGARVLAVTNELVRRAKRLKGNQGG